MGTFKKIILVALGYAILGRLAIVLAIPPGFASPVWPAAGLALGVALSEPLPVQLGVALGSTALNLWPALRLTSLWSAIRLAGLIGFGALLQARFARAMVIRGVGVRRTFRRPSEIASLYLGGGVIGSLINCTWTIWWLSLLGFLPYTRIFANWAAWWLGDVLGVCIGTPLYLLARYWSLWRNRILLTFPLIIMFLLACLFYLAAQFVFPSIPAVALWTMLTFMISILGLVGGLMLVVTGDLHLFCEACPLRPLEVTHDTE